MLVVGTSGWQYDSWRGRFYARELRSQDWLSAYADAFETVEVNNTFYHLPEATVFEAWSRAVPPGFRFALKMSRYLTHIKRLRDPEEPIDRFMQRACRLGRHLGPVLLQLPPSLPCDADRLERVLQVFPDKVQLAVEFRHSSWFVPEVESLLRAKGAALCRSDRRGKRLEPAWDTAPFHYVRLHEGVATPPPSYGRGALTRWVERLDVARHRTVWIYFNNDALACAVRDAGRFASIARHRGIEVTRTPPARAVRQAAA